MRNDFYEGYLEHSFLSRVGAKLGSMWKKHKYVARVEISKGKYRYFYSQLEYDIYLKGKKLLEKAKGLKNDLVIKGKKRIDEILYKTPYGKKKLREEQEYKEVQRRWEAYDKRLSHYLKTIEGHYHSDAKDSYSEMSRMLNDIEDNYPMKKYKWNKDQDMIAVNSKNRDDTKRKASEILQEYDQLLADGKYKESAKKYQEYLKAWEDAYKYNNNCAICAVAYDARRRGYNAYAPQAISGRSATIKSLYNLEKGDVRRWKQTNKSVGMAVSTADAIKSDILKRNPEGSYGYLGLGWANADCGHGCIWSIENGDVVIRDAQTGKKEKFNDYVTRAYFVEYFRMDDKYMYDHALELVTNAEEINPYGEIIKAKRKSNSEKAAS